jgi:hypothetical protein
MAHKESRNVRVGNGQPCFLVDSIMDRFKKLLADLASIARGPRGQPMVVFLVGIRYGIPDTTHVNIEGDLFVDCGNGDYSCCHGRSPFPCGLTLCAVNPGKANQFSANDRREKPIFVKSCTVVTRQLAGKAIADTNNPIGLLDQFAPKIVTNLLDCRCHG